MPPAELPHGQSDPASPRPAEAPEVREAMANAERFAALAEAESNTKQKDFYERMSRKWRGIAEGYRFIVEVAQHR